MVLTNYSRIDLKILSLFHYAELWRLTEFICHESIHIITNRKMIIITFLSQFNRPIDLCLFWPMKNNCFDLVKLSKTTFIDHNTKILRLNTWMREPKPVRDNVPTHVSVRRMSLMSKETFFRVFLQSLKFEYFGCIIWNVTFLTFCQNIRLSRDVKTQVHSDWPTLKP